MTAQATHCGRDVTTVSPRRPVSGPAPVRRSDLTVHVLDGEALMFDAVSGDTHRLNETALFIWRQCNGRRDASRVAARLTEVYDVPKAYALEHVERMMEELEHRHLVTTPP